MKNIQWDEVPGYQRCPQVFFFIEILRLKILCKDTDGQ